MFILVISAWSAPFTLAHACAFAGLGIRDELLPRHDVHPAEVVLHRSAVSHAAQST